MIDAEKVVLFDDLMRLWDNERGISLENPVLASLITEAMLSNPSNATLTSFAKMYQLSEGSNFEDFFNVMRIAT